MGSTIIPILDGHRQRWKELVDTALRANTPAPRVVSEYSGLTEIHNFGPNPGALRAFEYVPARPDPALVVVLHGCAQTAADYDLGAGWSTLADRYGFVLLLPQQQAANNPKMGFNWFLPGDIARGEGEALSIRQMVETMIVAHGIDRRRVFVTGLSAGGAMTSVMLAAYPDVFAAGAIIAGLPYRTATNVNEAFQSMFQVRPRPAPEWGDLVRAASPHQGPWPRVSVWHGGADSMVRPENADEIVKQWVDVHGLHHAPTRVEKIDGYPRQVWRNRAGHDVIESYTIPGMAHGTPLAAGLSDRHCGVPGAFLLDVGISSSYHIAKFWGLTGRPRSASVEPRNRARKSPASTRNPTATLAGVRVPVTPANLAPAALARLVNRLRARLSL